jgi:hypothetical protein
VSDQRDIILAVLQSAIGLAGLLLVFMGFLLGKAATLPGKYTTSFKVLSAVSLVAILLNLGLSYASVLALQGNRYWCGHLLFGLKASLCLTAVVGAIGLWASF